jgi:hypothetical protein
VERHEPEAAEIQRGEMLDQRLQLLETQDRELNGVDSPLEKVEARAKSPAPRAPVGKPHQEIRTRRSAREPPRRKIGDRRSDALRGDEAPGDASSRAARLEAQREPMDADHFTTRWRSDAGASTAVHQRIDPVLANFLPTTLPTTHADR